MKNKESQVFLFAKMLFLQGRESKKWEKEDLPEKKNCFCEIFFLEKICEGESLNTRIFFYNILAKKKKATRNLFCDWKINKNESKEERFQQ